ncbi:MAG: dihydroxyacetone kinase subunit DhaK [Clostridiales bacterium]|nr:dihydroxyacetone kinase subunit DhaK [Clostridiales bacterium]
MKKIMNTAAHFVDEMLEGILAAHPDRVKLCTGSNRVILNAHPPREGKVGIVTAGGSGHLPVFLGYVGDGMLDGCAVGNVFASPSASAMAAMIRACDQGAGVLCLYGNYNGDKLNFNMACEEVEFDDIRTRTVLVMDDVASSPPEKADKRRGVAGMVYAFKVAGAAAVKGLDLDGVAAAAQMALDNTRTMGVALSACIVPEAGKATFAIEDDEIEIGMGIHGEPGIEVRKMMTADQIAELVLEKLMNDMPLHAGDEVSIMVNGLGATPLEEQYIVYRRLHKILTDKGIKVFMPHIGEFATSMEMAGLSVTLMKLNDSLKEYLAAPASTPFYTNANK